MRTTSVVTRLQDNGDGGYTLYAYNNEDELIQDHPKCREYDRDENGDLKRPIKQIFTGCSDELREQILTEYDPYENGYIGSDEIKVHQNKDGSLTLAKPLCFGLGQ